MLWPGNCYAAWGRLISVVHVHLATETDKWKEDLSFGAFFKCSWVRDIFVKNYLQLNLTLWAHIVKKWGPWNAQCTVQHISFASMVTSEIPEAKQEQEQAGFRFASIQESPSGIQLGNYSKIYFLCIIIWHPQAEWQGNMWLVTNLFELLQENLQDPEARTASWDQRPNEGWCLEQGSSAPVRNVGSLPPFLISLPL